MNKKLLLLLCIFLQGVQIFAQKVDLDGKKVPYSYFRLPEEPINPESERTFTVEAIVGATIGGAITTQYLKQASIIDGFTRLNEGGRVLIKIELKSFQITKSVVETAQVNNATVYTPVTEYIYNLSSNVTDSKNAKLINTYSRYKYGVDKDVVRGANYNNARDANGALAAVSPATLIGGLVEGLISRTNSMVSQKIGYTSVLAQPTFYYMDSKKHPENDVLNAKFAQLEKLVPLCVAENPSLVAPKQEAKAVLEYFEGLPGKYATDDKQHRKMRYAGFYNAALLHFVLEDFDAATRFAQKVIDNDYDGKDGKRLLKEIEEAKKQLTTNDFKSRHFPLTWKKQDEMPESVALEFAKSNAKQAETKKTELESVDFNFKTSKISIISKKEGSLEGTVDMNMFSYINIGNNLKNVVVNGEKDKTIKPENYQTIIFADDAHEGFAGKTFESIKFLKIASENNKNSLPIPQKYFAEKFVSGKIEIYKFYDIDGGLAFIGKSTEQIIATAKTDEQKIKLDKMVKNGLSNPQYLVRKGDGNAKYLINTELDKLFEDNKPFLEAYKKGNTGKKKGFFERMSQTRYERVATNDGTIADIAKKVEAIMEYNEAK